MNHMLFFGFFPEPHAARQIAGRIPHLQAAHALIGKALPEARFHVSICSVWQGLRSPSKEVVAQFMQAAAQVDFPPFVVEFDRIMSFGENAERHPLVLGGDDGLIGLHNVHDLLVQALLGLNPRFKTRKTFKPHVTLLYDRKPIAEQPVEPIKWTVRELVLVESLQGQGRYIQRGVHPLGSKAA